jgi:transcriptional regulator with XRE-family HTH domain
MSEETTRGANAEPALRSLADKVNWLIDTARPAGRDPYSNAEVAALIERTTGERVSYTTIWKLRNGQAANPQMKLIEAMARTFGAPPGFFFDDFDDGQAGLLHEQAELLALVRNARVSSAQLRVILEWSPEIRRAVIHLISTLTAQCEAQRRCAEGGALAQQQTPDKGAVTHSLLACLTGWAARRGPRFTGGELRPFPRSLPPNRTGPLSGHHGSPAITPRA